jgi:hypothetical protein
MSGREPTLFVKVYFNVKKGCLQFWSNSIFVVFFKASEEGIDIAFIQLLAAMHANFFAKFFVVACAEPRHRCVVDAAELATGIIIVKDIVGWIFFIYSLAVLTFYNMDAIVLTIKQCVYITQSFSPFMAGGP